MAAAATASSPDSIRKFYLVPACETEADPTLISGKMHKHLSKIGEQQAKKVAKTLSSVPFSTIYCSDLRNAKETAVIIGQGFYTPISTKFLGEFSFGELEGKLISSYVDILNKAIRSFDYDTIEKRRSFRIAKGAENVQEAFDRMSNVLKTIASKATDQNIVIVSHARLINAFMATILFRDIHAIQVKKGGLAVFEYNSDRFFFSGGKKISAAGKTPQEGLFERSLLGKGVEEGWGNKIPESKKNRFIALADSFFAGINDRKIMDELAEIYACTAGHKSEAKARYVKEKHRKALGSYAKHLILDSIEETKGFASVVKGNIAPGSPLINQLLLFLYEFGDAEMLSTYVHSLYSHFGNECPVDDFVREWAKKVYQDFQERKPISFSMLAKLIRDKRISYDSIESIPPFNDPKLSFDILKKLAALGVKEAEDALCWAYYYNQIGLGLSIEERLEGLRELAEQGNEMAQGKIGAVYEENKFHDLDICNLTEEQRKDGIESLFKIEGTRKHNFYITELCWNNGFDKLPYQLSLQERIDTLQARAKSGDHQSLDYLLLMCDENRIGDAERKSKIDLKWDAQQRLNKIEELEIIANDTGKMHLDHIGGLFACWIKDNSIGYEENKISLNWSLEGRIDCLKELAFKRRNLDAADALAEAYVKNRLKNEKLNMSFDERLAKLHELALNGSRKAASKAAKFYSNNQSVIHEFRDIDHSVMDNQTKTQKLIELIIEGRHYNLDKHLTMNESLKGVLKLIFTTLQTLDQR
ncbi:MAG TPA: histidine phosphatase family protein [Rhabdochlamydiaceae bacterium]|nr:histidine phosphatase family protein [Rhabdochlamydiaceae bacterium]